MADWNQALARGIVEENPKLTDICKNVLERTCVHPVDMVTVTSLFFDGNTEENFIECMMNFIDWAKSLIINNDTRYVTLKDTDFDYAFRQEMCEKRGVVDGELEGIKQTLYTRRILLDQEMTASFKKLFKCMLRFSDVCKRMPRCYPTESRKISWRIQKKLAAGKTSGLFVLIDKTEITTVVEYLRKRSPYPWMEDKRFLDDNTNSSDSLGKVTLHVDSAFARWIFIKKELMNYASKGRVNVCTDVGLECYIEIPLLQELDNESISELYKVKVRWLYGDNDNIGGQDDLGKLFNEEDDKIIEEECYNDYEEDDDNEFCNDDDDDDETEVNETDGQQRMNVQQETRYGFAIFQTYALIHCSFALLGKRKKEFRRKN